jgi:hypothetical protein
MVQGESKGKMMKDFADVFEHYLEEWSTDAYPQVTVGYNFHKGDKSVGEPDSFEIAVLRGKKDIWMVLSNVEQHEIEQACKQHMKEQNDRI